MKEWKAPKRNWKRIQFESLRRLVDPKFNEAHDVLSKAYYEKKPFVWKGKDWGLLDKETFDKLHGLIFQKRAVAFHKENIKQAVKEQIPEEKYDLVLDENDTVIDRESDRAGREIEKLKQKGMELEI